MSTEVLEAIPESGSRNDPISPQNTGVFVSGTRQNVTLGATSCGLSAVSPPILTMVVGNEHTGTLSAASHPSLDSSTEGTSGGRKRHYSTSKAAGQVKRRRKTYERNGPKPKFLLGGSITDPLNLNSLADEEISKIANATPAASPLQLHSARLCKDPDGDPVIIPQDYKDPLKLNSVSDNEDSTSSLTRTLVPRKLLGKKKKPRSSDTKRETEEANNTDRSEGSPSLRPLRLELQNSKTSNRTAKMADKIVSPVLPDSRSRKRKSRSEPSSRLAKALLIDNLQPQSNLSCEPEAKRPRKSPEIVGKFRRQHSHDAKPAKHKPKFRDQDKKFQYGNYSRYYGYRNPDSDDGRITLFKHEWFKGKKCLDIGCNTGHVTLAIAKTFEPSMIVGLDIDGNLIGVARRNVRHCVEDQYRDRLGKGKSQFPISMEKSYGSLIIPADPESPNAKDPLKQRVTSFPANVLFRCANFVLENDSLLQTQKEEFDTILCLSVTKWIHLNWGDSGIKRFFQRIYRALNPGGRLILEPQAWPSYQKKRKMTETTFCHYEKIRFKPHQFKDYLLSQDVGFASCEVIGTPLNKSKGFRRPILMFTKLHIGGRPVSRMPSTERTLVSTPLSTTGTSSQPRWSDTQRKSPHVRDTSGKYGETPCKARGGHLDKEKGVVIEKRIEMTKGETVDSRVIDSTMPGEHHGNIHHKKGHATTEMKEDATIPTVEHSQLGVLRRQDFQTDEACGKALDNTAPKLPTSGESGHQGRVGDQE